MDQMDRSIFHKVTLEPLWEVIRIYNNFSSRGGAAVEVKAIIQRELALTFDWKVVGGITPMAQKRIFSRQWQVVRTC